MLRHVLFDNDGTIVDSEIIAVRLMLRHLASLGIHLDEREYSQRFPGLLERDIVSILSREHAIEFPSDFLQRLREEHVQAFQRELRAIPGMSSLFRSLRVPKSMVSNGSVRHVERSLRRVRLRHALDGHIFSAEHVERPKPHPDVYQFALDTLRLQPHDVIVVEDSPTGVAAAKSAGLRVVGFLGAAHVFDGHGDKLRSQGADWLAEDAQALGRILAGQGAV